MLSSVDLNNGERTSLELGRVLAVRGSEASIGLIEWSWTNPEETRTTVGQFLGIRGHNKVIIGVVTDSSIQGLPVARERGYAVNVSVDLMGELRTDAKGKVHFVRGVTEYPSIGDAAYLISQDELKAIYDISSKATIDIGSLQQDNSLRAYINIDEMLSKHFAVLGTTGVGKSSGVAVILKEILDGRPDLRVFLVDPHNEYGRCFGDRSQVLTPANLRLPFWLFNFEEMVDVLFRGRPGVDEEVDILAEIIPLARKAYASGERATAGRRSDSRGYTVDTPVPYRMNDLVGLIDERMGKLENRTSRTTYNKLLMRIDSVTNDPRYAFMFANANVGGDTMSSILSQLFRMPTEGRPMTIMQLAGFPVEVVDSVVSVLGRMAFDFGLWSDGKLPLLFVCEEAHRYAAADRSIGFGPTRRAISRIAKEGRKYGVFLGLITQRPAELDPTIISQCSSLFVMRMLNERDQALVRAAVSDAAANLLGFVPSLGTREVFAFGEAVALPTRLRFKEIAAERLPRSEAVSESETDFGSTVDQAFIDQVVDRWRTATLSSRVRNEPVVEPEAPAAAPPRPVRGARDLQLTLDADRYRLLKKPAAKG
jgi:DNA helicase HerA-like ATPase